MIVVTCRRWSRWHIVWARVGDGPWRFDGWYFALRGTPYRVQVWPFRIYRWTL